MSFKDLILGEIITYCLKTLNTYYVQLASTPPEAQSSLLDLIYQAMKAIHSGLVFDFAGRFDDTLENPPYNLMPLAWVPILTNTTMLQTIVDITVNVRNEEHQILVTMSF